MSRLPLFALLVAIIILAVALGRVWQREMDDRDLIARITRNQELIIEIQDLRAQR